MAATWRDCVGLRKNNEAGFLTGVTTLVEPFRLSTTNLGDLTIAGKDEENMKNYEDFGGAAGISQKLLCHERNGIVGNPEDLDARKKAFGENMFPEPPFESWFSIFFDCFKDAILIILLIASVISIIVESIEHPEKGFIDGLAILLAVIIVASVTATNDYKKQLQFRALHAESKKRIEVQVIRGGKTMSIGTTELVVGDLVHIETGAKLPADGVVLRSSDFVCNESAMTGESDEKPKDSKKHPFLFSGAQVISGTCDYVVTAVGIRSVQGQIMSDVANEDGDTPLQEKLDTLATRIGYVGMACAVGTFIAMMIIKATGAQADRTWINWTIHSFIYAVTIIVVAIPEGLPLAVTISLAYSTRKMLADQNLIRHLAACETMGGATDICSDKTGTLTENRMTVVQTWMAGRIALLNNTDAVDSPDRSVTLQQIPAGVRDLMRDQLALNSTAITMFTDKGKREVRGSKTEGAGVMLVESMGYDIPTLRREAIDDGSMIKQYSFSSDRKMMSTMVKLPNGKVRMFTTGGSDFILSRSTKMLRLPGLTRIGQIVEDADKAFTADMNATPETIVLTPELTDSLVNDVIVAMARQSLRTLGVAYRDFDSIEAIPAGWETSAPESDLTLFAVLGIKDPLRKDVKEAVETCQKAGVVVRMVTGDNKITATAISKECGILKDGGLVMEGPDFRLLTPAQLDQLLPYLVVLARSSPRDKNILVRRLNGNLPKTREEWEKEHPDCNFEELKDKLLPGFYDEWAEARKLSGSRVYKAVVGVTGDGTNDAPALKAADVGLSMGISGTQVAMDASDIVILDDRFSSIVKAVLWGRSVYDNVQKFLQFQLTVNVVALSITFISAVIQQDPPLNPIMMLWVNLIMDTMGALALGTETPRPILLDRKPYDSAASLILPRMWRHIFTQAAFQLSTLLVLLLVAEEEFGINIDFINSTGKKNTSPSVPATQEDVHVYKSTFLFNTFVFSQIFNEFNARSLGDDINAFKGLIGNRLFIGIIIVSMGLQALIVELGGDFCKTSGLVGMHWLYSILIGLITVPLGIVMRFIPVPNRMTDYAEYWKRAFYQMLESKKDAAKLTIALPKLNKPQSSARLIKKDQQKDGKRKDEQSTPEHSSANAAGLSVSAPFSPSDELSLIADASTGFSPVPLGMGKRSQFFVPEEAGK